MPLLVLLALGSAFALYSSKSGAQGSFSLETVKADMDKLSVDNPSIYKALMKALDDSDRSGTFGAMRSFGSGFSARYPALTAYIGRKFPS